MDFALDLYPNSPNARKANTRLRINPRTGEIMDLLASSGSIFALQPGAFAGRAAARAVEQDYRKSAYCQWRRQENSYQTAETMSAPEADYEEHACAADKQRRERSRRQAAQRAKRNVYDYAICNKWDYFITLTFAPDSVDRYDYKATYRKVRTWLDNRVRRRGLKYLGVAEYHKKTDIDVARDAGEDWAGKVPADFGRRGIHYHFLCTADDWRVVDSGHKTKSGQTVYNLPDWTLGFATAIPVYGESAAVAAYIAKYVTKQMDSTGDGVCDGPIGGRYYLHGGQLKSPVIQHYTTDLSQLQALAEYGDNKPQRPLLGAPVASAEARPAVRSYRPDGLFIRYYYIDTSRIALHLRN